MANNEKTPRYWFEYNGEKHLVPPEYVYQLHPTKGGGYDISAAFFSWAFNKFNISIVGYETLYANQMDLRPAAKSKEEKAEVPTGIVYFAVLCRGRDKRGIEKCGVGEVGNESITNFQRGFPYGIAAKRARVNMGKEFFGLTDLNHALDCRDHKVTFGEFNGKTLAEIASTSRGVEAIKWFASDKFQGEPVLKGKAREFCEMYLNKGNTPNPNQNDNTNKQNPSNTNSKSQGNRPPAQTNNNPAGERRGLTKEQKEKLSRYRDGKKVDIKEITKIAVNAIGNNFSWDTITEEQGNILLNKLAEKYGYV